MCRYHVDIILREKGGVESDFVNQPEVLSFELWTDFDVRQLVFQLSLIMFLYFYIFFLNNFEKFCFIHF